MSNDLVRHALQILTTSHYGVHPIFDDLYAIYPHPCGGFLALLKFPNNYGASILWSWFSYGYPDRLELGVIIWDGEHYELTYKTPIANDVIGWLLASDVIDILIRIKNLP